MDFTPHGISHEERLSRLRLLRSEGIGPVTFHALIKAFGSAIATVSRWPSIARRLRKATPTALSPLDDARRELELIAAYSVTLLAHDEPGYPMALALMAATSFGLWLTFKRKHWL
jgi:DNA processing protein